MISSLVAMAPHRKHSKLLAPGSSFLFQIFLAAGLSHVWVSGPEHELIAVLAPSPSSPGMLWFSKSTFLILAGGAGWSGWGVMCRRWMVEEEGALPSMAKPKGLLPA